MSDNDIYTFESNFFQTKLKTVPGKLNEAHLKLKNPSFTELNKMISDYPPSPQHPAPNPKPEPRKTRTGSKSSRGGYERSPYREEDLLKECTFRPKINEVPWKEDRKISLSERIANLSKSRRETVEQREKLKKMQEISQAASFNYTPTITKYFCKATVPVEDRFRHEKKRLENRDQQKRTQELEKEAECTFHPVICRKGRSQLPLYRRVDEVQIEKLRSFTLLKRKYEIDNSFKPEINKNSRNLSALRKRNTDSAGCLSRTDSAGRGSFTADVSPFKLPSRQAFDHSDFLNRQSRHLEKAAEHRRTKENQVFKDLTFAPVINKTSSILAEANSSPMTMLQKSRKLSEGNLEKLKKIDQIRENFYTQFRHSPEINETSKKIGRQSSIEKLAQNTKEKLVAKRVEEIKKQDLSNCTFSPGINLGKQFQGVKSSYRQSSDVLKNIEKSLNEKTEKSKEIRFSKDYEELQACSFRPVINTKILHSGSLKKIKGIERYFELKNISKRLSKEKFDREARVFCQRPSSTSRY